MTQSLMQDSPAVWEGYREYRIVSTALILPLNGKWNIYLHRIGQIVSSRVLDLLAVAPNKQHATAIHRQTPRGY
jgi:hypothetical protein